MQIVIEEDNLPWLDVIVNKFYWVISKLDTYLLVPMLIDIFTDSCHQVKPIAPTDFMLIAMLIAIFEVVQ